MKLFDIINIITNNSHTHSRDPTLEFPELWAVKLCETGLESNRHLTEMKERKLSAFSRDP